MATLVLSAVGTLVGGPVGGAIGALVGRQVDGAIFGGGGREGPRLKDLAITTSSYGQPLPRHFGRMRVSGSVIWATDLVENRETSGGGKGKPKTTSYSYSSSFAVALSSRPIASVGRIWADGNLLRGAAGDLKTGGVLRIHPGHGDQQPDPLIASAEGPSCPAFRNCAYAVFEDLDLADFGNRIPALTFEIFADQGPVSLGALTEPLGGDAVAAATFAEMVGYSHEGGALRDQLATIGTLFPLGCDCGGDTLSIGAAASSAALASTLPAAVMAPDEDDFGTAGGYSRERGSGSSDDGVPDAVRYYDVERDFQPGLQRSDGRPVTAASRTLEFPAAMRPDGARALVTAANQRGQWMHDRLAWRIAELDPTVGPGDLVRVPDVGGVWSIAAWEWRDGAIELDLVRHPPIAGSAAPGEPGLPGLPPDSYPWPTHLRAFELPWDGIGDPATRAVFAAASAGGASWRGAALYAQRLGVLEPLGATGRDRSTAGQLAVALPASPALLLEGQAYLAVELLAEDLGFAPTGADALAAGANRLLVGGEIVQFAHAEREGERLWRLSGLLRGRGGTEAAARAGHAAGTPITLLDGNLVPVSLDWSDSTGEQTLAAIGQAETEPVTASVEQAGTTRRPLCPVHPRATRLASGGLELRWIRRARGAWTWPGEIETPLVEQDERYRVGIGPADAPVATWEVGQPSLVVEAGALAALAADNPGAPVWVRQIGSHAASDPLHLCDLD